MWEGVQVLAVACAVLLWCPVQQCYGEHAAGPDETDGLSSCAGGTCVVPAVSVCWYRATGDVVQTCEDMGTSHRMQTQQDNGPVEECVANVVSTPLSLEQARAHAEHAGFAGTAGHGMSWLPPLFVLRNGDSAAGRFVRVSSTCGINALPQVNVAFVGCSDAQLWTITPVL